MTLTSPSSCAECHVIREPKSPGTLWATPGLLRDSFPLHRCLNDLWESTSFGIQYLTHFINRLVGYGNISNGLNPDMCPFPTKGPNYLYLNIIYSVRKDRSMWSQRRKSDSDSESVFSLTNFETYLLATASGVYY